MGSHAKPRTRVRTIALGTLAVGATLTGVGLTAAALDPAGASLADGTRGGDAVDLASSGLGAPVPVAEVSSLGGGLSTGTLSIGTIPALGAGSAAQGLLPGSGTAVRPRQPAPEPTWAHGATVTGGVPEYETPQGGATGDSPSNGAGSSASGGGGGGSNGGSGSGSHGNSGGGGGGGGSLTELTSLLPGGPLSTGSLSTGSLTTGSLTSLPTGSLPAGRLPLDRLSASSVEKTLDQVAPGVPGSLSTDFGKAKSTVSGLLNEVAGLL
jgi:hypothetical protein